jgi:photosystem II stability/assembly factor-like uncharacterized protein
VKSEDAGINWLDSGLGTLLRIVVTTLADSSVVYAVLDRANGSSLWRSSDSGGTWLQTGSVPPATIQALAADPKDPDVLVAGTIGGGVYRSVDGGNNWTPFNRGMETLTVFDLDFDASSRVLYAATEQGVFTIEIRSPRVVAPRP